jgi:hypothetical protein
MIPLTLQLTFNEDEGLYHIEILRDEEELIFDAAYNDKEEAQRYGSVLQALTEIPLWITPEFVKASI